MCECGAMDRCYCWSNPCICGAAERCYCGRAAAELAEPRDQAPGPAEADPERSDQ